MPVPEELLPAGRTLLQSRTLPKVSYPSIMEGLLPECHASISYLLFHFPAQGYPPNASWEERPSSPFPTG